MPGISLIPLLLALVPFAGAVVVFVVGEKQAAIRNRVTTAICVLEAVLAAVLFQAVREAPVLLELPWFLGFGLRWEVDFIGGLFALVVSIVWLLSTVFACEYMAHEHGQARFAAFMLFTLGACVSVFTAGDLFSLFLFFELMTFSAYVLVIHEEDHASLQAGNVYLYMSILGGLALLAAVFVIQHAAGNTEFVPQLEKIVEQGISPWILFIFVILGFGVKAGLVPLHIWLPRAHPVAPSPASALLSAIMIKAGAYGFLRFLMTILTPESTEALWIYPQQFGYIFLWIGAITMTLGALMAIINDSMKRVLAYSSISQMGYILFALGVGAFLGTHGAVGFAGAWMHMLNHAFYKSFLFLIAGAVFMRTHELDFASLGGFFRKMPWLFGFMLVAAASITGVPGFNGYVSKILIHEAIVEAHHLKHWPSLLLLERIFVITGGLTAAYITKLWISVFTGKLSSRWEKIKDISLTHKLIFGVYTVIVIGIGLFAQTRVNQLVLPAAALFRFSAHDLEHLHHVPFWHAKELSGPVQAYVIGLLVLLFSAKLGRRVTIPRWLSVELLVYRPVVAGFRGLVIWLGHLHVPQMPKLPPMPKVPRIDSQGIRMGKDLGRGIAATAEAAFKNRQTHQPLRLKESFQKAYAAKFGHEGEAAEDDDIFWNTQNLSFDSLLVALVIALALLIFLTVRI